MSGITTIKRTGYLHGGVTHPDGRRGFFKGAEKDSREKGTSMSPGTDSKGNQRDQSPSGQRDDLRTYDFNTSLSNPDGRPNYKQTPPSKPKVTPKNKIKTNPFESYFNYHPVVSTLDKIAKSKYSTNVNAKRRGDYLDDLFETDIDEYNQVMSDLSKIGMITGPSVIGSTQIGPQVTTDYGMPKGPPSQLTSNFEEIDGRKSLGDPAALEILGQKYKDTLPTFDDGGGGKGPQPYLPINYNTGAASVEAVEPYTNDFEYRFGNNQNVGRDVTRGYAADGGIMGTRARRAFGGIMDRVTGRKAYGLGSIFKSVGKAVKGVAKAAGKVLKSDVGKMALLAAGAYYAPAMFGGTTGFGAGSTYGNFARGLGKSAIGQGIQGIGKKALFTNGSLDFGKAAIFGTSMLPLLGIGTKAKPNEDIGMADRGGRLQDSQGNDALPADLRAEVQEAYASGDSDRIKQIQKYYSFLPPTNQYLPYEEFGEAGYRTTVATGGRIGFNGGGIFTPSDLLLLKKFKYDPKEVATHKDGGKGLIDSLKTVGYNMGGRINKAEGGLMDLGGMEKDYRNDGGFVPIGEYEKKDDVPARLSVNEFVFTADAVRGAGGGDIDKGAEIMENVMKNLEGGGQMSKESQGNTGAQDMFSVSQRLGEVL